MAATSTILFGAGGHAKVVAEAFLAANAGIPLIVLDDGRAAGAPFLSLTVTGGRDWLTAERITGASLIPAIGSNTARAALIAWARSIGLALETVRHPSCILSPSAVVGRGVFLAPGVIVNAETRVGDGAIVNTGASVDHDGDLGAACHIAPGARLCGGVTIGARTLIGVGTVVTPGVRIGPDLVIRAGSVVTRDIDRPDGTVAKGLK